MNNLNIEQFECRGSYEYNMRLVRDVAKSSFSKLEGNLQFWLCQVFHQFFREGHFQILVMGGYLTVYYESLQCCLSKG